MCVNKKLFLTSNSQFRGVARKSYLGGEGGGGNCNIDRKIIIHKFINKK